MTTPIPIGVTASFANVQPNVATADFTLPEGLAVITFQPVDVNNPGVVSVYADAETNNNITADAVLFTMNAAGYETLQVPVGGGTYFFLATLGANILAATVISVPFRQ